MDLSIVPEHSFCVLRGLGQRPNKHETGGFRVNGIKGYISIREASYRWGVSERRVNQYCAEGRIPGASRFGRSWAIPENAEKPSDPRFQEQRRDPGRTST